MAEPLKAHHGAPDCDECGGEGHVDAPDALDEPGHVYVQDCDECDGTGKTEWRPFDGDLDEPGECDRCPAFDVPVDGASGCDVLCAACYQAMHDSVCGCGAKVATPEQIAASKGLAVVEGGAA